MLDKSLSAFRKSVLAVSRGIWQGKLDLLSGADALFSAINRGYNQAWIDGAKSCGIKPDERTQEETDELNRLIGDNSQYVGRYVEWIQEHNKASGSSWEMIKSRAELWVNRYNEVLAKAQTMACQNKKLRWQLGKCKEHCRSCLKLNGRVHRASLWAEKNIYPRATTGILACNGYRCCCEFVETDEPATKGRFPKLP